MEKILKIQDTENVYIITKPDNISWNSPKIQEELAQENIVFNGCLFAVKIVKRKMSNPLLVLGFEDDSRICFSKYQGQYENRFDASWSNDLISIVKTAQEIANKMIHEEK